MSLERYLVVAPNGVLVSAYFMNETDSDARLRANCGREVPVHKAILASASPMFRMIFEMKEEPKPIVTMDMSYEAIVETMRYIYLAVVNYGCKAGIIEELIEAAETLHMPKFRSVLEEALIERSFNHMTL